jgi:hypothetical protein
MPAAQIYARQGITQSTKLFGDETTAPVAAVYAPAAA